LRGALRRLARRLSVIAALDPWLARARRYLDRDLWRRDAGGSRAAQLARHALQLGVIVAQGVSRNQTLLRASALTYFTMLSLIPLLALAIGLVEAFGASREIVTLVETQIAAVSPEAGLRIRELVERVDFRSLGVVGGATLFLTTLLALSSVEKALNQIWGVGEHRPLVRRVPDYLAVLVVAPLLLTVAVSLATSLRSEAVVERVLAHPVLADLYRIGLRQAPTLLFWGAFTFLYWFLPNASVRIGPALAGGALAALLFSLVQLAYVALQVGVARANALFGSFAALPILLVWIYFSWAIVLLGAELAFAWQNLGSFRQAREGEEPTPAAREAIALALAVRLARAFREPSGGMDDEALAGELDVPVRTIRSILAELASAGLVAPRGDPMLGGWQLGRAAESIGVLDVLGALRGTRSFAGEERPRDPRVQALVARLDRSVADAVGDRTLADLVDAAPPHPGRSVDPAKGAA
jgi:membrane protein